MFETIIKNLSENHELLLFLMFSNEIIFVSLVIRIFRLFTFGEPIKNKV